MTVKAFFSDQAGAPVLNGSVGSLIKVLDACLVEGFNQVNVSSMTRSGSTVTVTCATPHGYEDPGTTFWVQNGVVNVAAIRGATQAEYNGDWPVTYVSPTVFTFDIGNATPATPATGSIITKRAPAGFSKPFADTNIGVYRSNDATGRRHYWQVIDDGTCPNRQNGVFAGCRGFEHMSSATAGGGAYPSQNQVAWGQYLCKSSTADATARHWALYSDGKTVILVLHPDKAGTDPATYSRVSDYSGVFGFGDLLSPAPNAYASFCSADNSTSTVWHSATYTGLLSPAGGNNASPNIAGFSSSYPGSIAVARSWSGVQSAAFPCAVIGMGYSQPECIGKKAHLMYPDALSNRYFLGQLTIFEPNTQGAVMRGALPLYEGGCGPVHTNREIIEHVVGREGRKFQYIAAGARNRAIGGAYIDLTGDQSGKWS